MRTVLSRIRKLFHGDEWNIGIVRSPVWSFLKPADHPYIQWLPGPPRGKFLADPFGIERNGRIYILFEEYDYALNKGVISAGELRYDGDYSYLGSVINLPVHLSYPYLIEHNGDVYCIPEMCRAGRLDLYKARDFPISWEKVSTLIDGFAAVDATVFRYDGRWWLMCTDRDRGENQSLFIWHAPDLMGPWEPHAGNPVKTDITSARPGGTPFMHDGYLYRPAQDCSKTYGWRIVINRVMRLTPSEFEEEFAAEITPDRRGPFPHGLHTVSAIGDLTLIDGKRLMPPLGAFYIAVQQRIAAFGRKDKDIVSG